MVEEYTGGSSCPIEYCGCSDEYEPRYGGSTESSNTGSSEPAQYVGEYGDPTEDNYNL